MNSDSRFGLAEAELKAAFRQKGCPVCLLKQETSRRYVDHLLWENVNDAATRVHLVRGLGLCAEHTWQVYRAEQTTFSDRLGFAIIHQDLTALVASRLQALGQELQTRRRSHGRWLQRVSGRLCEVLLHGSQLSTGNGVEHLMAIEQCRACSFAEASEQNYILWLVAALSEDAFRDSYAASDGLCLAHLRLALRQALDAGSDAVCFLIDDAAARLLTLTANLGEYSRKRAWQYRHETLSVSERDSPLRAARFFGGQDKWQQEITNRGGNKDGEEGLVNL